MSWAKGLLHKKNNMLGGKVASCVKDWISSRNQSHTRDWMTWLSKQVWEIRIILGLYN